MFKKVLMFDTIKKFVKRTSEGSVLMSFKDDDFTIAELLFKKTDNKWLHLATILYGDNLPVGSKIKITQIGIEEIKKYQR